MRRRRAGFATLIQSWRRAVHRCRRRLRIGCSFDVRYSAESSTLNPRRHELENRLGSLLGDPWGGLVGIDINGRRFLRVLDIRKSAEVQNQIRAQHAHQYAGRSGFRWAAELRHCQRGSNARQPHPWCDEKIGQGSTQRDPTRSPKRRRKMADQKLTHFRLQPFVTASDAHRHACGLKHASHASRQFPRSRGPAPDATLDRRGMFELRQQFG